MKTNTPILSFVFLLLIFFTSCEKQDLSETLPIDSQSLILEGQSSLAKNGQDKKTEPSTNPAIEIHFDGKKPNVKEFQQKVEKVLDSKIQEAQKAKNPVLTQALKDRKKSFSAHVQGIYDTFCLFDGLNVTYYWVTFWRNKVFVESINIQLFKSSKDDVQDVVNAHEDGHASIADNITTQLTDKIAAEARKQKKSGNAYWQFVQSELQRLDHCAQMCYDEIADHENLMDSTPKEQMDIAGKVANAIVKAYCDNPSFDCAAWCEALKLKCKEDPEPPMDEEIPG